MKMLKLLALTALILILLLAGGIICLRRCPFFSPPGKQEGYDVCHWQDSTLRIAVIGDSWADFYKSQHSNVPSMVGDALHRQIEMRIAGVSGLTSKEIYLSMFNVDSVRSVVEWGPDYCLVMAGVNDSERKMGTGYYKESMRLTIGFLLEQGITPVIFEIPRFNPWRMYHYRKGKPFLIYLASMVVTMSPVDCIDDYRLALEQLVDEQGWRDSLVFIHCDQWNPEGYRDVRDLYDDMQLHLNERGYQVLDSCIAAMIIAHLTCSRTTPSAHARPSCARLGR